MRALLVLALVLLAAAPAAQAHIETYSQGRSLRVGNYLAQVEPQPSPAFANETISLSALLSKMSTGGVARNAKLDVQAIGPAFQRNFTLVDNGDGYHVAPATLPAPGNYTLRIVITDDAGVHTNDTYLEVYPNLPIRLRSADPAQDLTSGRVTPLVIETVDPFTLTRKDGVTDLRMAIEHWTDDHRQMLGVKEVDMKRTGTGVWRVDHTFDPAGMYHLRFASGSGGFNYDDVPLLHVYAYAPEDNTGGGDNKTPAPGLLGAALALAAVALLARRR